MALKLNDLISLYLLSFLDNQTLSLFLAFPMYAGYILEPGAEGFPRLSVPSRTKKKTPPLRAGNVYFIHCCIHSI